MNRLRSAEIFGLKSIPKDEYFSSMEDVDQYALDGQAHYMRRAFQSMALDGIFCIEGKPTVYLKNFTSSLNRSQINQVHKKFWNQSIATILILQDPQKLYIFSGMVKPDNDISIWEAVLLTKFHYCPGLLLGTCTKRLSGCCQKISNPGRVGSLLD